jgi:hypothetical protein
MNNRITSPSTEKPEEDVSYSLSFFLEEEERVTREEGAQKQRMGVPNEPTYLMAGLPPPFQPPV